MKSLKSHIYIISAVVFYIFSTATFITWSALDRQQDMLAQVDEALVQAAMIIPTVLPVNFHHAGMNKSSIPREQDMKNIRMLSDIIKDTEIVYLYSMILKNGRVYFSSSSATEEEIKTGVNLAHYYYEYDDAVAGLYDVFKTRQRAFIEYTDKWGTFRSVFIPITANDGSVYVVAADAKISAISGKTGEIVINGIMESVFHLLILLPFFIAYKLHFRKINRDLDTQIKQRTEELEISNAKLAKLATTDYLTDIPNRRHFFMMAEQLFKVAKREIKPISLIMLDIDHFKDVNDNYGHIVGDNVLVMVTGVIRDGLRKADLLGRVGGEEMAILLFDTDLAGAITIAEKLRNAVEQTVFQEGEFKLGVTASMGCTELSLQDEALSELYNRADQLLYDAKRDGRNRIVSSKRENNTQSVHGGV